MTKKIIVILIINICFTAVTAVSQINTRFFTNEQKYINQATQDVLYIVRQDYILKDTTSLNPNEYGIAGHNYFGRVYRLAILSENKLWCDNSVLTPWFRDVNYVEYKDDRAIQPVLSKVYVRKITERNYTQLNQSDLQTTSFDSLLNKISIHYYSFPDSIKGIANKKEVKTDKSWVILASTQESISENDSCDIKLTIYQMPTNFTENKLDVVVKEPTVTENLLGGIYLTEEVSIGEIDFFFAGILNKRALNWYVSSIPKTVDNTLVAIPSTPTVTPTIDQTPVNNSSYATLTFVSSDGVILKDLCNIKSENTESDFCTNENGVVKIPIAPNETNILVSLNEVGAACVEKDNSYEIVCKKKRNKYVSKKKITKCK